MSFQQWWDSQVWGTVPEWFAAIGTVGALAATIYIVAQDRRRNRRSAAQAFSLWAVGKVTHTPSNNRRFIEIHAYNGSPGPIPVADAISRLVTDESMGFPSSPPLLYNLATDAQGPAAIQPGETRVRSVEVAQFIDHSEVWVLFVTHDGMPWVKRLSDNRLYSARRGRRVAGLTRTDRTSAGRVLRVLNRIRGVRQ